jgi:hypothetical protein
VKHSPAEQEVALAVVAAANVETETLQGKITKTHNLDFHELIDGLDKNTKNATVDMSNALKDLTQVSPNTKNAKCLT